MRRSTLLAARLVAVAAMLAGGWLVAVAPAGAVDAPTIDDTGWWSRAKQEPTIGSALVFPDVTPGQLLVEATPEGATAIAAVRASLPEGAGNPVLTLRAGSQLGAQAAVLLACQAGSGWTGAYAGAWDAKPSPDCSQSVQAIPSDDGSEWTFALAPLQFDSQIDVVLTPGREPNSEEAFSSAFRVVFERPTSDAITVTAGAAPGDIPSLPSSPPPAPTSAGGGAPSPPPAVSTGGSPSFSVPSPPSPSELAQQPAQAALPDDEQGATATAPSLQGAEPLAGPPVAASGTGGQAFGVLVVLLAGALLWWSSQQPIPERQVLSRFATTSTATASVVPAAQPTMGGLGRFRRERSTAARRLG